MADKSHLPSINLDIQFKEMTIGSRFVRFLSLSTSLPMGLTLQSEVCADDNWSITGFMNVLRNNLDIWILHGQPLRNDERRPIRQPRDSLLVYHTSDNENNLIVTTHTMSESPLQIHMRCSNKVIDGLANYLDEIGFSNPLEE